jgi:hypothetical protein
MLRCTIRFKKTKRQLGVGFSSSYPITLGTFETMCALFASHEDHCSSTPRQIVD